MSKVWIVSVGDMDGNAIHGVFSSEEKANEYIAALVEPWKRAANIDAYVIDEPVND